MRPRVQDMDETKSLLAALPREAETDAERARLLDTLEKQQRRLRKFNGPFRMTAC